MTVLMTTMTVVLGMMVVLVAAIAVVAIPMVALLVDGRSLKQFLHEKLPRTLGGWFHADTRTTVLAGRTRRDPIRAPGEEATQLLGRRGPYQLHRRLSQSESGEVWQARDTRTGTTVAFKCPSTDRHADDLIRGRERLTREVTAQRASSGPHVVAVHDTGEIAGVPFLATAWASGGSLLDLLHRHPDGLPAGEVALIVKQVAAALSATLAAGWVHRDVKAANIVLDPDLGRWLLCDFGIAQVLGEPALDRLTAPGFIVGTPTHLAPELFADMGDGTASPCSESYSLAVVAYQLLTGTLPHTSAHAALAGPSAVLSSHRRELVALDAVLHRALAADPDRRYPTPAAFAHTLARVVDATHPPASRTGRRLRRGAR